MIASLLTAALAASSVAAAPLQARAYNNPESSHLENYDVYHARYLALGCSQKHSDPAFFDACCHPLHADQSAEELYTKNNGMCRPQNGSVEAASSSISSAAAQKTSPVPSASAPAATSDSVQPGDDAGAQYFDAGASSSAAPSSTSTEAPKPSPTEEPKQEEQKQDDNKDQGNQGGNVIAPIGAGMATHFTPWDGTGKSFSEDPIKGACEFEWNDYGGLQGDWVALNSGLFDHKKYCGNKVRITSKANGATVIATVLDECPSCHTKEHIDVSPSVFNKLQNVVSIPFDSDEQPDNDPGELEVEWDILA